MKIIFRIIAAGFVLAPISGCDLLDSHMVKLCEAGIKKRLRSPSTYQRVEIKEYETEISRDELLDYLKSQNSSEEMQTFYMRRFDDGTAKPLKASAFISYDAQNAFGTPVRGLENCEFVAPDGQLDKAADYSITIGGLTYTRWLLEQVKAQ